MPFQEITLPVHTDDSCACGRLVVIEEGRQTPFEIRRVYYIYAVSDDVSRGAHAHRDSAQMLICLHGSCKIVLDDGISRRESVLDSPEKSLLQPRLVWGEMSDFTEDAVLLVLSDSHYDPEDYIHDYAEFLQLAGMQR